MCRIWKLQEDLATFDLINWNSAISNLSNIVIHQVSSNVLVGKSFNS